MIETDRLILRAWRPGDASGHRQLVTDPRVIPSLGRPPTAAVSRMVVGRQNDHLAAHGYCFWAVEERASRSFIGWCGFQTGKPPLKGQVEIGWSLLPSRWGRGYAREGAEASLAWAWRHTRLRDVVAITTPGNVRSWSLMERLGMTRHVEEDFDHPDLRIGDRLSRHILYRIARPDGA